jgi:vacuolar-type H+-ATPase catalytic subunit A/Vma1
MSLYENRMAQWTQAYENALPDLSPSRAKAYRLRDLLKNVWAGSVERYVEAVLKNPDPSNAPDMTVLMDEAAKEKGYKDWADLCVKVAMSDPELYEKVVVNVAKFMTQRMVWMSEEMAKRKKGK